MFFESIFVLQLRFHKLHFQSRHGLSPAPLHADGVRGSLCYLGAFCLQDSLRLEAPTAVAGLQDAGVHVVMITGDAPETAASIGRACGIVNRECDIVLSGEELALLSDTRVGDILPRLAVVARALPSDKSRLVRLAQERGLVVQFLICSKRLLSTRRW